MKAKHNIMTNLRLWSVQAGLAGGALTTALASLQAAGVKVPAVAIAASGILTAVGVFGARMFGQPDVVTSTDKPEGPDQ